MSLDIRIRTDRPDHQEGLEISFDNDGYYWFFHPLFERLRDETGKYIDLYGDATFSRDDYPRLLHLLDEADVIARRQPKTWEVHVGTQVRPTRKELYRTVHRDHVLKIITTLRNMVDAADKLGGHLECIGD